MSLTTDPNDTRLGHGSNTTQVPQNEAYLILSAEERRLGFVRPYREAYIHVGIRPKHATRELTADEKQRYADYGYVLYEEYPKDSGSSVLGRYWTQDQLLSSGCQLSTKMTVEIAETYARNPKFYGSTYCVHCRMHRPLEEFAWLDGTKVGS